MSRPQPQSEISETRTRLAANTFAPLVVNVSSILISIVTLPLLITGLGPEIFGLWALLQGFSAITGWVSMLDFGLMIGGTRAISRKVGENDDEAVNRLTRTTLSIFLVLSICFTVIALSASAVLPAMFNWSTIDEISSIAAIILIIGLQGSIDLYSRGIVTSLDGLQRVDLSRISDGIRRTCFLLASGFTALQTESLQQTLTAGLISSCITTILQLCILVRIRSPIVLLPTTAAFKELTTETRSVGLLRPLGVVNRTMDKFILGSISGLSSVGTLEVSNSLQAGANALISASTDAVTPTTSFLSGAQQFEQLKNVSLRMTRLSIVLCGPLITVLIVTPEPLLELWLGDQVPTDAAIFTQLSFAAVFISLLTTSLSNTIVGLGSASSVVVIAAIATTVNLGLSIAFALTVGPVGVLVGTTLSAAITAPLILIKAKRLLSITYAQIISSSWLRGLAPSILTAAILFIAKPTSSLEISNVLIALTVVTLGTTSAIFVSLTSEERAKIFRR